MTTTLVRGTSLIQQIVDIMVKRINSGIYLPGSQLPSEINLADEFQVSRTTVRNAISALSARRLVIRRQGVGTFVTKLSRIKNSLNQAVDFGSILAASGSKVDVELIHVELLNPTSALAGSLDITTAELVLQMHKVFSADNEPCVFSVSSVPAWVLPEGLLEDFAYFPGLTDPLYHFLEHNCDQWVSYHIANITVGLSEDSCFHNPLPYPSGTPVLLISEVGYNSDECPVFHAREYFPNDQMVFELVRHRNKVRK